MALVVTIDSKENAVHADSNAVLLRVPNKLLFTWYQSNTAPADYVSLVNVAILDKVIQLKVTVHGLILCHARTFISIQNIGP